MMPNKRKGLPEWLDLISRTHPSEIEMGLDRIREVWSRLLRDSLLPGPIARKTVVIAGTNGKGTTAFALAKLLMDHGCSVGVYSSPHIVRYNERVQFNGQPVDDELLIDSFERVEAKREGTPLTYFEFGTLAGLVALAQFRPDVAILEVGLGGRLDAVNIIDADLAIITSVGLDHTEWLGDDLTKIAREKAGILRQGQSVLLGESLPEVVDEISNRLSCKALTVGKHIILKEGKLQLRRSCDPAEAGSLECDGPESLLPENNICLAVQGFLELLVQLEVEKYPESRTCLSQLVAGLSNLAVPGRMEQLHHRPDVFADVCHNPHAAVYLSKLLSRHRKRYRKIVAVFSALEDKDVKGVVEAVHSQIDQWLLAPLQVPRAAALARLQTEVGHHTKDVLSFRCVEDALGAAVEVSSEDTFVIVFGSFYVVEAATVYFADGAFNSKHTQNEE